MKHICLRKENVLSPTLTSYKIKQNSLHRRNIYTGATVPHCNIALKKNSSSTLYYCKKYVVRIFQIRQ